VGDAWVVADGRTFHLHKQFPFIYMLGNAFQHFLSRADQEALLARVREHLHPEGCFLFGTRNPSPRNLFEARRSNVADHPMLHTFLTMTMDERWAKRTPEEMFHTFHGFHGEGFGLILEDLLDLPADVPVLVEGYKLLPRLVAPLLSRPDQAVWLIPTPEWRRTALSRRGSLWSIAGQTSDPEKALANLLARDALYAEEVYRQAVALQFTIIEVSGNASVDELATGVAQCLGIRRR
jgi:hypothetical protein